MEQKKRKMKKRKTNERKMKERFKSIKNYKKPAFWAAASVTAFAAAAVCFLTNPANKKDSPTVTASSKIRTENADASFKQTDNPGRDLTDAGGTGSKDDSVSAADKNIADKNSVTRNGTAQSSEKQIHAGQKNTAKDPQATSQDISEPLKRFLKTDWKEIKSRNLSVPKEGAADFTGIICIGKIPEKDITLYGYNDKDYSYQGVAIETGSRVSYFDWYYSSPRCLLPDCFWNEKERCLQVALNIYTGTGAAASQLHVLRQSADGSLQDYTLDINDYSRLLQERIRFTYDSKTKLLVLYDTQTQKELAEITVTSENVKNEIDGLELGFISRFHLGKTITLEAEAGYFCNQSAVAEYEQKSPALRAEILLDYDRELPFTLGRIQTAD